jgi:hypothetical protein
MITKLLHTMLRQNNKKQTIFDRFRSFLNRNKSKKSNRRRRIYSNECYKGNFSTDTRLSSRSCSMSSSRTL